MITQSYLRLIFPLVEKFNIWPWEKNCLWSQVTKNKEIIDMATYRNIETVRSTITHKTFETNSSFQIHTRIISKKK